MNNVWFIADTHFSHANILKYCNRPFADVREMDETIIENWNSLVDDLDIVWVLGDFCMSRNVAVIRSYLMRLKGRICITLGDHDAYKGVMKSAGFDTVRDLVNFTSHRSLGKNSITLCHWPFAIWRKSHYNSWCLHGHCHGKYYASGKIHDVGVDNNDFKPLSLEQIKVIMDEKEDNSNVVNNGK